MKDFGLPRLLCALVFSLQIVGCSNGGRPAEEARSSDAPRPSRGVILISVDTLRADHLGAYGYQLATSPTFDRLAARGTLFERAVVQYPSTLTSHMSIFTGLYPQEHQVLPPSTILAETITTLPQRFQAGGFRTSGHTEGGFVAGGYGFDRGFDEFSDTAYQADTDIERTYERGLQFLRSLQPDERFFLFLHTYSVHDPYDPPAEYQELFWSQPVPATFESTGENLRRVNSGELEITAETVDYFRALYDASVRYSDDVLGRFVEQLEGLGLLQETTLVITSDHGEEFWEHNRMAHTQVYPESLLVPLLILHPGAPGGRVSEVVESVDLAPTLLELAGLEPAAEVSGRSLVPHIAGAAERGRASQGYAEVFDVEFVRTVVAQDRDRRFQLVMVEPEWDPVGPWIRDQFTFDTDERVVRFEAQSFHRPRRVRVELEGRPHGVLDLQPVWQPVEIELPEGEPPFRVTLIGDGCVSPAEVGQGDDGRCLAFQIRQYRPRRFELYDLVSDPLAKRDLFREEREIRGRLADRILALEWESRGETEERLLSAEDEATLRALGYLD